MDKTVQDLRDVRVETEGEELADVFGVRGEAEVVSGCDGLETG
jgi:hypothetical protein